MEGSLPEDFDFAFLWLLPKGDGGGLGHFLRRDARPLTGSNTDAKCLAPALAYSMNLVVDSWAFFRQRGLIKNRIIFHNILDVEALGLEFSYRYKHAAIFLLDYSSAFPSIDR